MELKQKIVVLEEHLLKKENYIAGILSEKAELE